MRDTLLDLAKSQYNVAKLIFENIRDDDVYLNITGYHLQQATELALKHLLEVKGIRYPKTHVIQELLSLLPKNVPVATTELVLMSGTITEWESKTRYIKNFRLAEEQLTAGFKIIGKLLEDVSNMEPAHDNILLQYLDEKDIPDFLECTPKNIEITADNVSLLVSMYKSIRKKK